MKKELLSFKNLIKFILIILFLLSISFIVQYNIKEYNKQLNNTSNVVKESYVFLKDLNALEINNTTEFNREVEVKKEILNKLNEEMYTIDSPLIINNPYGINPLSAYIAFNTKEIKNINVVINGEFSYISNESKTHILPVFYLYPDEVNRVTLNGIEIQISLNLENKPIDNNQDSLLFIHDDILRAYKNQKQVMDLSIIFDDFKILDDGNFLIKQDDILSIVTPYGLITNVCHFNEDIKDFSISNDNLYVLLENSLIKLNKYTLEESILPINNVSLIDTYNDYLIVSIDNSIYFYNSNGELVYIFGDINQEYKDYYLKKYYNTHSLNGILDFLYKDNYLYVLENNNTLKVFIINDSNKSIRLYKTITNINSSSISYEDKIILNNYVIDNFKVSNILNVNSKNSIIKYPNIKINETNNLYYQNSKMNFNSIDDNTVNTFKDSELKELEINKLDNILIINSLFESEDEVSIILLNEKGESLEYRIKEINSSLNRYIDISEINDGKYFIYTKVNSKVYNVNRYIVKRSVYE